MGSAAAFVGAALWLAGCGLLPPRGGGDAKDSPARGEEPVDQAAIRAAQAERWEEPGSLDSLLDAKPIQLAAVKPVSPGGAAPSQAAPEASSGKGRFRVQVGAENDFDAAQAKKKEFERKLGGTVDVVFDAPYYKLRWGFFETKQEAQDKILELTEKNIQGFVVKQ
jgi:hypothetical protein